MEDVAALQLAQPSLGKMAVKEPAQPFSAADSGLWHSLFTTTRSQATHRELFCAVRHCPKTDMVAAAAIVRAAFASGAAPPPGRLRACSRCHGEGGLYTRGKRRSGGAAAVIRRPCASCGGIGLVDGMLPPPRHEPGPRDRAFVGTVAIAGGGIGGAAAALALQQRGFRVVVYERDSNFDQRAQGYGLTMQQGATALAQLGLPNEGVFSYAHSSFLPDGTLLGEYGRGVHESTRERMGNGRGKAQRRNAHIPRQALRAALLDPLLPGTVRWGKAIARFDAGDSGVILHFEDGSPPERAALLVGADGIRSRVREQLLGAAPLEYLGVVVVLGRSRTSHAAASERVFQTLDGDTRLYVMPFEAGVAMWQLSFRLGEAEARAIQTLDGASLRALALRRCGAGTSRVCTRAALPAPFKEPPREARASP